MDFSSHQQEIGATLTKHQVDRISTLPDDIISNKILSLLLTKDSVRTSALSNRWKHLYASVPVLNFQSEARLPRRLDPAFADFVSNALNTVINNLSHISRLYIDLEHVHVHDSDIISWIETATSHSVQTLDVTSRSVRTLDVGSHSLRKLVYGIQHRRVPYPYSLFTCDTLVSLSLDIPFVLCVPDVVCLPNLKNLWLKGFEFRDEPDNEDMYSRGFNVLSSTAWRLAYIVPALFQVVTAFMGLLYGQDLPDGKYTRRQKSKTKNEALDVIFSGLKNYRGWILSLTYGFNKCDTNWSIYQILLGVQIVEYSNILFESDCLQLVNIIQGKSNCPWDLIYFMDQIKQQFRIRELKIMHIEREGNKGADHLANLGCKEDPIISNCLEDFSDYLKGVIITEALKIPYLIIK